MISGESAHERGMKIRREILGDEHVDTAIERTTDFTADFQDFIILFAHRRITQAGSAFRQAACYNKRHSTFADVLAQARKELWAQEAITCGSSLETDTIKVPRSFVERLTDAVCYAA